MTWAAALGTNRIQAAKFRQSKTKGTALGGWLCAGMVRTGGSMAQLWEPEVVLRAGKHEQPAKLRV